MFGQKLYISGLLPLGDGVNTPFNRSLSFTICQLVNKVQCSQCVEQSLLLFRSCWAYLQSGCCCLVLNFLIYGKYLLPHHHHASFNDDWDLLYNSGQVLIYYKYPFIHTHIHTYIYVYICAWVYSLIKYSNISNISNIQLEENGIS